MAAGRDNELQEHVSDFGIPGKEDGYLEGCFDLISHGDGETERLLTQGQANSENRGRIRQNDIKEREVFSGEYQSSRSQSDSGTGIDGTRKCGFAVEKLEREPGELFSDGSDEGFDSEIQASTEAELKKTINGNELSSSQCKKRKFSPIIWDKDDKDISRTVKSKHTSGTNNLQPHPPLVIGAVDVKNTVVENGKEVTNLGESHIDLLPYLSDIRSETSPMPHEQPVFNNSAEVAVEDDDDVPQTRTINFSRWATESDSPVDEGEISDHENVPGINRDSVTSVAEARLSGRSLSPELWELKKEDYEGTRVRTSGSDDHIRSSGRDDQDGKDDFMEVDDHRDYNGTSIIQSESESEDKHGPLSTTGPAQPPHRSFNMLQGCRNVDEFERLNKIDEGTYGVVFRAKDKKTGEVVALKKVKMEKEREGFPLTSLREINILLSFHHPFIVDVKEVVVGNNLDSIFMVMEYMEHDLKALMETIKQPFSQSEVKCLMLQLLGGVKYLHDNWVLHRDLKTSNLLLNNRGELKICDLGLARQYGSPLKPYTSLVVTLWYRAPELLLGAKQYSTAIDMWSLGCIMAELLSKEPLFNGKTEVEQLDKIFKTLGTPSETIWPGFANLPGVKVNFVKHKYNILRRKFPATSFTGSPVLSDVGLDLLNKFLTYDPEKRITADEALNHPWFHEVPLPKSKEFMPTFPAQHAQDRRMRRVMKSPDPLEEQRRKELHGEIGTGGLFGQ